MRNKILIIATLTIIINVALHAKEYVGDLRGKTIIFIGNRTNHHLYKEQVLFATHCEG